MTRQLPIVLLLLLLTLGGSAGAQETAAHEIRLQRPWRQGDVLDASLDIDTHIAFTRLVDGKVGLSRIDRVYHLKCRLKVLEVDGDQWRRLSVTPSVLELRENGQLKKFSALDQVLLITRKDQDVTFQRADGLALQLGDDRLLKSFFSPVSEISPDDAFGPGKNVALNDSWDVNAEKLSAMFNSTSDLLQVDPKNVSGKLTLSTPTEKELAGLLRVAGEIKFSDMNAAARKIADVEDPKATAEMKVEYLLPTDPKAPRRSARMEFNWSFGGAFRQQPEARAAMQHRTVKTETMNLVTDVTEPAKQP